MPQGLRQVAACRRALMLYAGGRFAAGLRRGGQDEQPESLVKHTHTNWFSYWVSYRFSGEVAMLAASGDGCPFLSFVSRPWRRQSLRGPAWCQGLWQRLRE
ncbi:hypothetical protein GCM10022214_67530 [Actinomadura miaoliensis]|uniref:Uncharacterized protein n=1 Tax=Actinomadura miaoliensis TaxID=430685 RepID=A0ABP7WRN2_9ACTN